MGIFHCHDYWRVPKNYWISPSIFSHVYNIIIYIYTVLYRFLILFPLKNMCVYRYNRHYPMPWQTKLGQCTARWRLVRIKEGEMPGCEWGCASGCSETQLSINLYRNLDNESQGLKKSQSAGWELIFHQKFRHWCTLRRPSHDLRPE